MRTGNVLLITEANERVASGHLFECAELATALKDAGFHVCIAVNDDAGTPFKARLGSVFYEYKESVDKDLDFFKNLFRKQQFDCIVTDLREVNNDWINCIRSLTESNIICIDEWGHRTLGCDIIINPMIDPYFWDYGDSEAKVFTGHDYLILPGEIQKYHLHEKHISDVIGRVCISMGGVDRFGTTLKVLKWLMDDHKGIGVDVIVGAGFPFKSELDSMARGVASVDIKQNVSNIYEYFERADIVFCAGGNTLHERA